MRWLFYWRICLVDIYGYMDKPTLNRIKTPEFSIKDIVKSDCP